MEHKSAPARQKKVPVLEPVHYCGTCRFYTEVYYVGKRICWGEHCNAGKSYEHIRHTTDCDKWEKKVMQYEC